MVNRQLLAIIAILSASHPGYSGARPDVSLLSVGNFHKGEVRASSGERWMGLVKNGPESAWQFFPVEVQSVKDPLLDGEDQKSGTEVKVLSGEPLFLIRGVEGLARKKVKTARFNPLGPMLADQTPIQLSCQDCKGSLSLRIIDVKRGGGDVGRSSRLVLEGEGISQILYEWPEGFDDQHCELIWAGDLNGDGKIDLLMNLSDHYNVNEMTLLLSLKRPRGSLVEKVAVFRTTGC